MSHPFVGSVCFHSTMQQRLLLILPDILYFVNEKNNWMWNELQVQLIPGSPALVFHLPIPYLWTLPWLSLAAPTLMLIKQCQAFNKSLTGVMPWTVLFIKGLHCCRLLKSDWSRLAPVCPSAWLTSDTGAAHGRQRCTPGSESVFVLIDQSVCSISSPYKPINPTRSHLSKCKTSALKMPWWSDDVTLPVEGKKMIHFANEAALHQRSVGLVTFLTQCVKPDQDSIGLVMRRMEAEINLISNPSKSNLVSQIHQT